MILSAAITFVKLSVYAHFLDPHQFGLLSKILTLSSGFVAFGGLGMQHLTLKLLPIYYAKSGTEKFQNMVDASISIYIGLLLLSFSAH